MEDEEDTTYNSESDETVTLSEIVTGREVTLKEEEVWALCRECCLTLEFVHSTQELFQSLVITPETVAFDRDGNVCFLDLDADPDPLYIPPEYEEDGVSYKSHLFSLGMTLLFAVEYASNPEDEDAKASLSQDVRDLLTHLTQDNPENRPDLELVLEYCDRALQDISSQDVCQRFACIPTEEDIPKEEGTSLLSMTEELAAYLKNQNGLVTPAQHSSAAHSDSDSCKQVYSSSSSSQQVHSAETQTPQSSQAPTNVKAESSPQEKKDTVTANRPTPSMDLNQSSAGDDSSLASPRKNRRRQGLLLSEILSALERDLLEAELWALCRECVISLQRKRKHLPAYISPDTVMIRDMGSVSFKAIPEDKPLEVIYMAPELQQKGILNEKTCMYGLGVTLRCAAGHRQGDADMEDSVGLAFQELLTTLLEANPDHRPSLEVCLMACDEFEKQGSTDSRLLCQEIYMDACALNSSREPKKAEMPSVDLEDSALMATELQTSWTELEDAEKEEVFLEDQMEAEEETVQSDPKPQSFQPVAAKGQGTSSGSAFKPVPFKPKPGKVENEDKTSQSMFPSAFSSPANYFKPIVLESAPPSIKTKSHSTTGHVTEDEEKEKNVMQKLREIKKNLLKHRPPGNMAKDLEVDDTKPPVASEKTRTPRSNTSGRSSRKSSGAGETAGLLENLLTQIQNSGQMPDTDNLALAIAQHLHSRLGGEAGDGAKMSPGSAQNSAKSDKTKTETAQVKTSQPGDVETPASVQKSLPSTMKTVSSDPQTVSAVPQMSQASIPSSMPLPQFGGLGMGAVSQAGYMPMPMMPFAGGLMPGPVQYHIQQDPHTGLLQLVPVPVMPYSGSHSPHTPSSDPGHVSWQQPVTVSSGSGLTPDREEALQRHAARPGVNSRNARGLIQKTASQRAKNAAGASVSPTTGYLSDTGVGVSSPQLEDSVLPDAAGLPNKNGSHHRRSRSSGALEFGESAPASSGDIRDSNMEYVLTSPEGQPHPANRNVCDSKSPQVHRSSSQSSSPSPSKDSGICLTTQGTGGAPPVSSTSLMERLLSSDSLQHQHAVTQVLHILHQSFGDQGPDSFHSEEMLAEYIVSLAHLKWETFMSAVTEKYPQMFWSHTLLVNLFHAINKQLSNQSKSAVQTQPLGMEPNEFSRDDTFPHSKDSRTNDPNRKPCKPVLPGPHTREGGEYPQVSTEMKQRTEETWNKQRPRSERGPSSGKSAEADESHSVVRVLASGRYVSGPSETSDSTDNEQEEKRRRFKKRYELDRSKSSPLHSLPNTTKFSIPPEQGVSKSDNRMHRYTEKSSEQGENSSHSKQPPLHRIHGHMGLAPDQGVYDGRIAKSGTDGEASGAEKNFRSDSDMVQMSSPGNYHSLPRPSKSSQHQSRDGVPPSRSGGSGFSPSYREVYPHSPSNTHSDMPPHASQQQPQSQFGAMPQPQSSQRHLQPSSGVSGSYVLQRPESRDTHTPLRDSTHHQGQERNNLNNSSGSSSYSPAFNQNARNGAGKRHPEHNHLIAQTDTQGFVYGQLREPAGKPPSNASPCVTGNLRNTHSLSNQSENRNSVPVFSSHHPPEVNRHSVPPFSSQGQSEVNNNAPKPGVGDRVSRSSQPSSPRNRERSPVRKTQHTVKPRLAWDQEIAEYRKKGQVVYHSAMIQLSMTPEVDRFIHSVDERSKSSIESKLASIEQEITMLRRQRRKSQAFYKRLTDPAVKQPKGDNKVSQVLKDMSEMTRKLRYLDLYRTHLQMLLAELHGIDTSFIHSLVSNRAVGGRLEEDPQPLVLQRCGDNAWLQFQTVREAGSGLEVQVLQAGHPEGLLAYLFTVSALSDGYIHQFLFCFRYFLRAEDVFAFITHKYLSAHKGNQNDPDIKRIQQRALDLLQFWVEGYYSLDFERNDALLDHLEAFIMQRVGEGTEGSQNLMNLLYACHLGENAELIRQADDSEDQDEVYYLHLASPKRTRAEQQMEWESFRSLIGRRKSENVAKASKKEEKGVVVEKRPPSRAEEGSTMSLSRRTDITQLMDYTPHRLAEQLTLMEQELFQRTHPVHYLDSKSQGIGVDLSIPSLRTPSMTRKAKPGSQSLFVGATLFEPRISELISHSQEITHWVSAEILCCGSQKSQVAALTKFLQTAHLCVEIRNYATALAIVAGLDNLLVRQLPAWKHLAAKAATLMEDLEAVQVRLKGETMALMQSKESHMFPTIPCILYFLLHLQQLEIGGFTLANGMYKWQKMRSISQMTDQIRIFREHEYGFKPDYELQSLIYRRLHELSDRDLHSVAAAHDNNFRRVVSHAAGLQGTWRKVKVKLHSKRK